MSSRTGSLRRISLAALTFSALVLVACRGDADETSGAPPSTGQPLPVVDWASGYDIDLAGGWEFSPCEGGPALMCIRLNGETRGVAELTTYPTGKYKAVKKVLDAGGSRDDALAAMAADFQKVFEKDRPVGCGPTYKVKPYGPTPAIVGGLAGVTYGFDGIASGRRVERAVQFAAIDGRTLYMIATTAVEDGTCMDDGELTELSIAEIDKLQGDLADAVASSRLPAPQPGN